jgi:hypothetical protein
LSLALTRNRDINPKLGLGGSTMRENATLISRFSGWPFNWPGYSSHPEQKFFTLS